MSRNYGAALGRRIEVNEVAAGNVIEKEAAAFNEAGDSRGLTAGSFGILEIERSNQRIIVRRNRFVVFL